LLQWAHGTVTSTDDQGEPLGAEDGDREGKALIAAPGGHAEPDVAEAPELDAGDERMHDPPGTGLGHKSPTAHRHPLEGREGACA
jgi:hypothetical protein